MYSKEMKGRPISTISGSGGDLSAPSSMRNESKEVYRHDEGEHPSQLHHQDKGSYFTMNYGNYGDPHSFIPYQLILLMADFVFNWSMDLVHESPLAVLIIFVFQSLAIIINLILYIMASASQAMRVGVQRRVNVHHWLNLCVCLIYMLLTGWWFIWALRKSWPSVSDQFSFTWNRGDTTKFPNGTTVDTTTIAPPLSLSNNNATRGSAIVHQVKEHYTLWGPGFNSVYVIHRTLGIIYYFIYLRASFIVLNSQKIDAFVEMKRELVRRLCEEKKANAMGRSSTGKRGQGARSSFNSIPITSEMELGLSEYLTGNGLSHEKEVSSGVRSSASRKRTKKQMSVSWTDEGKVRKTELASSPQFAVDRDDLEDAELSSQEIKKVKEKHRKKRLDDSELNGKVIGDSENEEVLPLPQRPKPRPRSSRHERQKRVERDSVEEWNGEED